MVTRCLYSTSRLEFSPATQPSFPSHPSVCSQLIPHNKRKPGLGRHRSRMGAHARTYVQEHAWRRSCLAFSLNGPRLLSPVYHHGRPRTPSAANLSPATPPPQRQPLASHFSPPTRHAQSCGIKTQATGGGVRGTRAWSRASRLTAVSQPVCSRDFGERTGYHLPSPVFNFTFLTIPYSFSLACIFSFSFLFSFFFLTRFDRRGGGRDDFFQGVSEKSVVFGRIKAKDLF